MRIKWDRVSIWSCKLVDEPGAIATKLAFLANAGASLDYVHTPGGSHGPGHGTFLHVATINGPAQVRAAQAAGFTESNEFYLHRIEAPNDAGLIHRMTQQWELANINLQGLFMATVGAKVVCYVGFDSIHDANKASRILADLNAELPSKE